MSISSSTRKAGPYSCNGATVAFPFSFKIFTAAEVLVVLTDAAGAESNLSLGTHYTVTINANQDANPGGTVTTTAVYAGGYRITLTSQVQNLQPVTLTNQGGFYPKIINDALDRLTIMVQQVAEQVGRAVKVGISSATSPDQLISTLLTAVANALGYSNAASASATAAAGSATTAASSATAAANSAVAAAGYVVPSQAGHSGALVTNGTSVSWLDSPLAMRNKIINGNGWIRQRSAPTLSASPQYGQCDRWIMAASGGTGVSGLIASAAMPDATNTSEGVGFGAVAASWTNAQPYVEQRIEQANTWSLGRSSGIFSGCIYHDFGSTTNFTIYLKKANSADNFGASTVLASTVVSVPSGTTTKFSLPYSFSAADAQNGVSVVVQQTATSVVANKNLLFSDMQLERGSVVTPFEQRPYGLELALCQRYYVQSGAQLNCGGYASSGGQSTYITYSLPQFMRALPSVVASWGGGVNANAGSFRSADAKTLESSISAVTTGAYSAVLTVTSFVAEL